MKIFIKQSFFLSCFFFAEATASKRSLEDNRVHHFLRNSEQRNLQGTCIQAQSETLGTGDLACMEEYPESQSYGCTSNDVRIAGVTLLEVRRDNVAIDPPYRCFEGELLSVDFTATVNNGAKSTRFDAGVFWSLGETALTGSDCSITRFLEDPSGGGLPDLEDPNDPATQDMCMDMPGQQFKTADICNLVIACQGDADVQVASCMTYKVPGANQQCADSFDPGDVLPGSPSKCKCEKVEFPIQVLQCNLAVAAVATCNEGTEQGTVDITTTVTGEFGDVSYLWSPGGETTANLDNAPAFDTNGDPISYRVDVTDAEGCTISAEVTPDCCFFSATCLLEDVELEGCDRSVVDPAVMDYDTVFSLDSRGACGTVILTSEDSTGGTNACPAGGGLTLTRTYYLLDDLDGDGEQGTNELRGMCRQEFTVKDNALPTIVSTQPMGESDECPGCATDDINNCFKMPTVSQVCQTPTLTGAEPIFDLNPTCSAGSRAGTYSKGWTVRDYCDRTEDITDLFELTDVTPPEITCAEGAGFACNSDLSAMPVGPTSVVDACDGVVTPDYEGCCFDATDGLTLNRKWSATDLCGNPSDCEQANPLSTSCPTRTA